MRRNRPLAHQQYRIQFYNRILNRTISVCVLSFAVLDDAVFPGTS